MILGPFEFDRPFWLLVAPLAILLTLWIARRSLTGLSPVVQRVATAIRIIAIILAAAALAEPSYRLKGEHVSVLVVQDLSKSMPPGMDVTFEDYLQKAVENAPLGSRLGVITAADAARAQVLPSPRSTPQAEVSEVMKKGVFDPGAAESTNLEEAMRLALAVKPEDTAARILLFSDGNETEGSLLAFADSARTAGVPVDVLPMPYSIERELVFDTLVAPTSGRIGQTVNLRFAITSTRATRARLGLLLNREPFDLTPGEEGMTTVTDLQPGNNVITVPVVLTRGGPQEFEAYVEPLTEDADTKPQNNTASAVTFVAAEGMVLLYTADPQASAPLQQALESVRLTLDVRNPGAGHSSLVELQRYDAIILFDVAAGAFSFKQQQELAAFVNDSGGGLIMIGGPDSFGAGGWIGTPVAEVLPVKLDPPEKRQIPKGALALIMHSCEMPEGNFWGQKTAAAAVNALSRLDEVGIIELDWQRGVGWTFPLQLKGDGVAAQQAIKRLTFGDMQDFDTAFQLALQGLNGTKAGAKHVIVISDGDPSGPAPSIINQFVAGKISVSTVMVFPHGIGGDQQKMQNIATATGGRFYFVNTNAALAQLPEIFIKESQTVKRSLIWEGDPVQPTVVNAAADPMRGISRTLPSVTGYVITAEREGLALVTVKGPNDDPIVAQWQSGLGRAVAFTPDAASRWSQAWLNWGQFRAFWDQHVRWAMRPSGSANLSIITQSRGDQTRVIVTALDTEGDSLNFARFQGRVVGPGETSQVVELRQVGPGRYEGDFASDVAGSYLLSLRYDAPRAGADGQPATVDSGTVQAAVTRPFADEHRALKDNTALLRQVAALTNGRVLDPDPLRADLFNPDTLTMPVATTSIWLPLTLVAIGVFLLDVGVRRVRVDFPAMARTIARMFGRAKQTTPQQLAGLRAAREGARARISERTAPASDQQAAAGVKFEATADQLRAASTSPLDAPSAPTAAPQQQPAKPADPSKPEEPGMSRLMQAKRRAQDRMKDDEPSR